MISPSNQPQLTNPIPEAKLARQKKLRQERAETRKAKRHAKAEAKKARKANVQPAGKWTEERRAADTEKKAAAQSSSGPGNKQEKRRRRLLVRAEKLEAQAQKLMIEAQKARARFDVLTELKQVRLFFFLSPPRCWFAVVEISCGWLRLPVPRSLELGGHIHSRGVRVPKCRWLKDPE